MNDKIKEKINYLKLWLGISVITILSLVSWYINNYETANKIILRGDIFFTVLLVLYSFNLHRKISKNINKLE